jgi:hypothetical protein
MSVVKARELLSGETGKAIPVPKPPVPHRAGGFVDLTPIANAGTQTRTLAEKGHKVVTRFTGLEPNVRKSLIEYEEELRELPKTAANITLAESKTKAHPKGFYDLTVEQERAMENYREHPDRYPEPPAEVMDVYDRLEQGITAWGKRLEEMGYSADWPNKYYRVGQAA